MHALSCALGYNIRWLMRALQAKARKALLWLLQMADAGRKLTLMAVQDHLRRLLAAMGAGTHRSSLAWQESRAVVLAG